MDAAMTAIPGIVLGSTSQSYLYGCHRYLSSEHHSSHLVEFERVSQPSPSTVESNKRSREQAKDPAPATEEHEHDEDKQYLTEKNSDSFVVEQQVDVDRMTKRRVDWPEESTTTLKLPPIDSVDYAIGELPCVKLRGLPFDVTVEEILVFFRGVRLLDVIMCTRYDGKPSGEAMVLLPSQEVLQQALQFDHQCIGTRYIEIFRATRVEYYNAAATEMQRLHGVAPVHRPPVMQPPAVQLAPSAPVHHHVAPIHHHAPPVHTPYQAHPQPVYQQYTAPVAAVDPSRPMPGILRMRGLPFDVTVRDVADFFAGHRFILDSIRLSRRADGRPTGDGFIMFDTFDDASRALDQLHKKNMGRRYIELFRAAPGELC